MDKEIKLIGAKIRFKRKQLGLTLVQLQELTGIDNGNLSRIERGSQNLTEQTLTKIASALGIPLYELLTEPSSRIIAGEQPTSITIRYRAFCSFKSLSDVPQGANVLISRVTVDFKQGETGKGAWSLDHEAPLMFNIRDISCIKSIPQNLVSILHMGRSMEPRLFDGDRVIVDTQESEIPESGGVFAFVFSSDLLIRRLFRRPGGGVIIKSDNPDYPGSEITREEFKKATIIGRVKYRSGPGDF